MTNELIFNGTPALIVLALRRRLPCAVLTPYDCAA